MCGIAGSWNSDDDPACASLLLSGLKALRHRGPDDAGTFAWVDSTAGARVDLGLARLAILDLSPLGHQPMTLADGSFTVSFNGEITNYVELRDELVALGVGFTSGSDTEVLLKAWAQWGAAVLPRLEGMFAFAMLDTKARVLTLARDAYGIKPLFYVSSRHRFAFNSELPALVRTEIATPRLDLQAAVDYLQWGYYDQTERSFVEGVTQLPPGHSLVLDVTTGRVEAPRRFWTPAVRQAYQGSYESAVDGVRTLFVDSVRRNLRSDVPLGVALSGGIDSSAIVGAVRMIDRDAPVETFSYIAPGFAQSEHEWIALVAGALDVRSHTVEASPDDLLRDLDDLIVTQGEPFGSTSIYAQYRVFKLAREHGVVVTLDGQGGDETFAGYSGYPSYRLHSLLQTGRLLEAKRFTSAWAAMNAGSAREAAMGAFGRLGPRSWHGRIVTAPRSPLIDSAYLKERGVDARYPLRTTRTEFGRQVASELRAALTRHGLPSLLRHGDRNSMRFSIESRVPFLDKPLTSLALSLPEEWLIGPDGTTKRILRDALRGIVPDAVLARRDKIGFATPQADWIGRLAAAPLDDDHPIGFLLNPAGRTVSGGLPAAHVGLGPGGLWRLINLRRWVALLGVDAR